MGLKNVVSEIYVESRKVYEVRSIKKSGVNFGILDSHKVLEDSTAHVESASYDFLNFQYFYFENQHGSYQQPAVSSQLSDFEKSTSFSLYMTVVEKVNCFLELIKHYLLWENQHSNQR